MRKKRAKVVRMARAEVVRTRRAEEAGQVLGGGTGGAVLLHVGTNNAEKEGTLAIVDKYRSLVNTLKEARIGHIKLSGYYQECKAVVRNIGTVGGWRFNTQVQKVCMKEGVGLVDMWLNVVGRDDFFTRDGLHLRGKGAAVLGCEYARVVDEGTGTTTYLN